MRILMILALAFAPAVFGQEAGEHKGEMAEPSIWWKWANFALLCGVLGALIGKNAGPFFKARTAGIQAGLREARKLSEDSEARAREIERRIVNLKTDMRTMREEAKKEMAAEGERIRTETARLMAKMQENAQQDIASSTKLARQELKSFAGSLAIQVATSRIRERLTPDTQDQLVREFVSELGSVQKATH
ncbi:MAG TPA: ATP synthase F0 subunit B [Bryobacteraceae bacterium]|nr:ATP synthase F0 subunit B [Bryobacteraceae bacterium]